MGRPPSTVSTRRRCFPRFGRIRMFACRTKIRWNANCASHANIRTDQPGILVCRAHAGSIRTLHAPDHRIHHSAGRRAYSGDQADNVEKDYSLNLTTAKLAAEYDLPLWNWWRPRRPLGDHGIDPYRDGFHISVAAWNVRSKTFLQTLDHL